MIKYALQCGDALQIELEIENVSFWGEREIRTRSKDENQQQTQPTFNAEAGNRTRATLVGGECSHCAVRAPHKNESSPKKTRFRLTEKLEYDDKQN